MIVLVHLGVICIIGLCGLIVDICPPLHPYALGLMLAAFCLQIFLMVYLEVSE